MLRNDLTGKKFGKLTVVRFDHKSKANSNLYECKCDCGKTIVARGVDLRKSFILSCGCPVTNADLENDPMQIAVGQKVKFDPFLDITGFSSELNRGKKVTGTVVYVNDPHKWFSVQYAGGRISFKFSQIGKDVKLAKN